MEVTDNRRLILERLVRGEISVDQAERQLQSEQKPASRQRRGRPRKVYERLVVSVIWIKFHERYGKQRLRDLLSESLCVDSSVISKHIARLNKLAKNPAYFIGRIRLDDSDDELVLMVSAREFGAIQRCIRRAHMRLGKDGLVCLFDSLLQCAINLG